MFPKISRTTQFLCFSLPPSEVLVVVYIKICILKKNITTVFNTNQFTIIVDNYLMSIGNN